MEWECLKSIRAARHHKGCYELGVESHDDDLPLRVTMCVMHGTLFEGESIISDRSIFLVTRNVRYSESRVPLCIVQSILQTL
jgi:hypothetical protein